MVRACAIDDIGDVDETLLDGKKTEILVAAKVVGVCDMENFMRALNAGVWENVIIARLHKLYARKTKIIRKLFCSAMERK